MSRSTKEEEMIAEIRAGSGIEGEVHGDRRVWVELPPEGLLDFCQYAKKIGFDHLSAISATDFPEEEQYELTHHLWSYKHKMLVTIRSRIGREEPVISSVGSVWASARIHERELHELFGVEFEGSPDLSELFLEDWEGMPPFRRDFDWREYVRSSYDKDDEREKVYWEDADERA